MPLISIDEKNYRRFHDVGRELFQNDPLWIAPLDMEVENIFKPDRNQNFKDGEASRWILTDENGNLQGRIAAFINHKKASRMPYPVGGMGFFMCRNNQDLANQLFDVARDWLSERGARAMDGSINFGENFSHWGVLVEGFMPQGYGMPYNPPFYRELFEKYGFHEYYLQYSYHIDLTKPFPERMVKFADYIGSRPGFSYAHYEKRNTSKYVQDLITVMNKTWADYMEDYDPITENEISAIIEDGKMLLDEDLIWFAYKDGEPIAMVVAFPDVNQLFQHFKGRLNFWKMLKLLWLKQRKTITRNRLLLAGVIPEYQNSGIIGSLFMYYARAILKKKSYNEIELSWVGDYNPRMRKMYEQIGAQHRKTHATFRYMIDASIPFERFSNEGGNSMLRRDAIKKKQQTD